MTFRSGEQFKKNKIGGACGTYGERRGAQRSLVENPEIERQLGRSIIEGQTILKGVLNR